MIAATALVLVAAMTASGCSSQQKTSAPAAKSEQSKDSSMTAVRLVDGAEYYGRESTIADGLLALDDVYFTYEPAPQTGGAGKLRRFGKEIHRPLARLIIPVDSLILEQPLAKESAVVKAVDEFEAADKRPADPSASVPSGQVMAVFLRTGDVFFGHVTIAGLIVRIEGAHYLRFRDQKAANAKEISSLDQLSLAPQSLLPIGPTGEIRAPLSSVLYIQPLAADSPVTKALK